ICHPLEHELSAFYDITHGLGLAILTPRWMRHVLSEKTVDRFVKFGVNVFGIDANLPKMEIAEKAIESLENFLYKDLGLTSNLTELGITDEYFDIMAERVSAGKGYFTDMTKEDCLAVYKACL
ncbi:MAG: iron-containing alcohol dehydrogenase, partial [Erysipelotrichales bacterium]|nr:iron-containing alcohol dehydrogenase [Erysipelotrichales bacterium]